MQIDAELSTLRTRLQGSWSAGSALSSMSKKLFVEEVIRHYDTFEKKVKMRILISLLGLDKAKKSELAQPIVKLLELASRDTSDEWIGITAGLVHQKLFDNRSNDSVEWMSKRQIQETVNTFITKIIHKHANGGSSNEDSVRGDTIHFEPLEFKYLSKELLQSILKESPSIPPSALSSSLSYDNHHFRFNGTVPDFIQREKRLNESNTSPNHKLNPLSQSSSQLSSPKGNLNDQNPTSSTILNKSSSNKSQLPSMFRSARPVLSQARGALPRESTGTAKLMSFDEIKKLQQKQTDTKSSTTDKEPVEKRAKIQD